MPRRRLWTIPKQLTALCRATEGAAAIELAIIAPVLIAILVPLIDLGLGFYQQMQVEDAAQAGAQYAMAHGYNSAAIQTAVSAATPLSGITASPSPVTACGCPNGMAVDAAACGATCANGQAAGTYVTVSAQSVYTPLVPYPGIGSSITLTAQSTARIQ
jgi:Flp pilus assembly protein TadG